MSYQGETIAPQTFEIRSASDLDALASGGVITVSSDTNFRFIGSVGPSSVEWVLDGATMHWVTGNLNNPRYLWNGTGNLISGTGTFRILDFMDVVSLSTGSLFDIDNLNATGTINLTLAGIFLFNSLGTINGGRFIYRQSEGFSNTSGLTLNETSLVIVNEAGLGVTSGTGLIVNNTRVKPLFAIKGASTLTPGTKLVRFGAGLLTGSAQVRGSQELADNIYDVTGTDGTFTAVAQAAIASETITSVTSGTAVSGGNRARFNFSGNPPTIFVNQEVVIVGYVTNTNYNTTGIITLEDGTGQAWFEIDGILFGTDEATGSFTSDSVTFTDTGTTLTDGDQVTIATTAATDYNSGGVVYNQLTNSFQLNRVFTLTRSGTWSTRGLDQIDPRVISALNPGSPVSRYIATAYVNNNAAANGAIINNTFTDMVFGTGGSALIEGSNIERWQLIDEVNGIFEYTGNEEFDGFITFDFTVVSTGGNVDFLFKWEIDEGGGFGDLPDNVIARVNVGSDAQSVTKTFPLRAKEGDLIKPQITRSSGASGITTTEATIYAQQ